MVASFPLHDAPALVTLAGDWHGNQRFACSRIEQAAAQGSTMVFQLGDFGVWSGADGVRYLDALSRACVDHDVDLLFLDGNHEDFTLLHHFPLDEHGLRPVRPRVWHVPRGTRWTWHGFTWCAVGGASSPDKVLRTSGVDWWPEELLTDGEAQIIASAGPVDVLLTHDCPLLGRPTLGAWPNEWDRADEAIARAHAERLTTLVEALEPHLVVHGHLHLPHSTYLGPTETPWGRPLRVVGLDADGTAANTHVLDPTRVG